jgi:hypothetical protein
MINIAMYIPFELFTLLIAKIALGIAVDNRQWLMTCVV